MSSRVPSSLLLWGLMLLAGSRARTWATSPNGTTLFASWNSSSQSETQWYLPITVPRAALISVNWGVEVDTVFPGWTPLNKTRSQTHFEPVLFLPFDNRTYITSTNYAYNQGDAKFNPFAIAQVWANAVNYAPNANSSDLAWLPASSAEGFFLGPRANFTTSRVVNSQDLTTVQNTTWSAVPFGLSIGGPRQNGSLVFGGSYDWARVNDTQWHKLPADLAECMLHIGRTGTGQPRDCKVDKTMVKVGNPPPGQEQFVLLDWTIGLIILPDSTTKSISDKAGGAVCYKPFNITLAGIDIDIDVSPGGPYPIEETGEEACIAGSGAEVEGTITLGLPFFQNLYIYADHDGSVYIARALFSNAPVSLRRFDPSATIEAHPEAKYKPPKSGGQSLSQNGWQGAIAFALASAIGLSLMLST